MKMGFIDRENEIYFDFLKEMHAENVMMMFPYFQDFSQEAQVQHHQLQEDMNKTNAASTSNLVQTSTISEYNLGGEGDLFKAPEPIIEERVTAIDPMAAAMSMISCGEDVISPQIMKAADIDSIQNGQLWSEVFYECKKDLLEKSVVEPFTEILDVKAPAVSMEDPIAEERLNGEFPIPKSVSSGCLSSMEWILGSAARLNLQDLQEIDFEAAYEIRRAFSEGDIQTLGNGNSSLFNSSLERRPTIGNYTLEERQQKLSRYRKKKSKRNFGRKIKTKDPYIAISVQESGSSAPGCRDFFSTP